MLCQKWRTIMTQSVVKIVPTDERARTRRRPILPDNLLAALLSGSCFSGQGRGGVCSPVGQNAVRQDHNKSYVYGKSLAWLSEWRGILGS